MVKCWNPLELYRRHKEKKDPVYAYMRETDRKRRAGTLGPELDEAVRQRVIENAKRYAAEQAGKKKG